MRPTHYSRLLLATVAMTSLAAAGQTRSGAMSEDSSVDANELDQRGANRLNGGVDSKRKQDAKVRRGRTVAPQSEVGAAGERDMSGTAGALSGTRRGSAADPDLLSVELKPIPTLLSFLPGVGAAGAGVEGMVTPQIAAYLDGFIVDSNLPERLDTEGRDRTKDDIYPEKFTGRMADLGARFYAEPYDSTWYAGAKIGLASMNGEFTYKNRERIDANYSAFTPGITAGYRWLLGNNDDVLVRLGAVASANVVQNIETDMRNLEGTPDEDDARDKIDDRVKTPFLANLDLGVGYQF